jgi:hypothetical protein
MTDEEALTEARRRWGDTAKVRRRPDLARLGLQPYTVGVQEGELFIIHGQGTSWEEAFHEAGQQRDDPSPAPQPPGPS